MDNCTLDCIQIMGNFSYEDTCNFVQDQCQQDSVQFVQGYYCILHQSFILFVIIAVRLFWNQVVLFVLLYLALNALTEHSLTPAVENVISRFSKSVCNFRNFTNFGRSNVFGICKWRSGCVDSDIGRCEYISFNIVDSIWIDFWRSTVQHSLYFISSNISKSIKKTESKSTRNLGSVIILYVRDWFFNNSFIGIWQDECLLSISATRCIRDVKNIVKPDT